MGVPPEWDVSPDPNDTYQRGFATHECVGKNGVTVRAGIELSSTKLGLIPRAALVVVEETKRASDGTYRCRLAPPHAGWCSAKVLMEMLPTKRRAVEPLTRWSPDAWAPAVVDVSAVNRGGHARCKFPLTVVLPAGSSTKKCKEQHRWHLMAVYCAGAEPASACPLLRAVATRLMLEKHVPAVFLDYEGTGAATAHPPPGDAADFRADDMRGAVRFALHRADQVVLVGRGEGARLLPGVANAMKECRKRVRAAACFDYAPYETPAAEEPSLVGKKGGAMTPNEKHKEIRSWPRLYVTGGDDRMGLVDLVNGSTDDSQVDVVPAGRGSDAEAVDRAVAWLKARKKRPWMPWDDDPDDTSDEEDDDTNE